ncbi:MAG TPA: flagellar hook capping FlgD N-terminal domain-containing protein [Thermoleophilaceae bacterium]|jgi:flagellar basal-body rod modification protein FlgD
MSVDPTSPITTPTTSAQQTERDGSSLDKDSFLKILVGELQNMDPMSQSSQDPTETVSQMTQYSILEQLTNLSTSADSTLSSQKQTQSLALLGKTVSYTDSNGEAAGGLVKKVDFGSDGSTLLTLDDGLQITPDDVAGVQ